MNLKYLTATALALLALAATPAQAQSKDENTTQELERARAEVEKARDELRRATRDLARSMARVEKDAPRADYFNFIANPRRAVLGVIISDDPDDGVERGVTVLAVTPGNAAEKAGLKAGDLITAINGKSLAADVVDKSSRPRGAERDGRRQPHQKMRDAMRELTAGDEVRLDYEREGKAASVTLVTQAPEPDLALSLPMLPPWIEHPHEGDEIESFAPLAHMFQYRGPAIRGLELAKLDPDLGHYFKTTEGVLVIKAPRSGALSLKSGDVIQKIDGAAVSEPVTVLDKLRSRNAAQDVKLEVLRQGRKVEIEGKIPVARADQRRLDRRRQVEVIVKDEDDDEGN